MIRTVSAAACVLSMASLAHAEAHSGVEAAQQAWAEAFNSQDIEAIGNLFAEDAALMPPDMAPITGHENILGFWKGGLDAGVTDLRLGMSEVLMMGDRAVEIGTYTVSGPWGEGGAMIEDSGKTMVVWRRAEDGTWQMTHDMWSSNSGE